jgi:hypothetical protein
MNNTKKVGTGCLKGIALIGAVFLGIIGSMSTHVMDEAKSHDNNEWFHKQAVALYAKNPDAEDVDIAIYADKLYDQDFGEHDGIKMALIGNNQTEQAYEDGQRAERREHYEGALRYAYREIQKAHGVREVATPTPTPAPVVTATPKPESWTAERIRKSGIFKEEQPKYVASTPEPTPYPTPSKKVAPMPKPKPTPVVKKYKYQFAVTFTVPGQGVAIMGITATDEADLRRIVASRYPGAVITEIRQNSKGTLVN